VVNGDDDRARRPPRLVKSAMKVGILSQYYPPEMGAPQARLAHLASEVRRRGHEVVVLTAFPNYPSGRIEPGYCGLLRREWRDGIRVFRTWLRPSQSVGLATRLMTYLSFVFSSLLVGWFALGRLDFLITESPPLFLGISGYLLARRTGARWIFNVSDLWPESAVRLGVVSEGWGLSAASALERFCYRKAWLVTGQSAEILANIRERFPGVATYHLSNGVDVTLFRPDRKESATRGLLLDGASEPACIALYAGLHGIAQGLEQLLDAAEDLAGRRELRFVFVGDGPERTHLIEVARSRGLQNVRFLDPLPRERMPAVLASADIALIPLKTALPGAVPSKIYEAMGAGVPILLLADGEAAEIVRRAGAGLVAGPGQRRDATQALEKLLTDHGLRATLGRSGRAVAEAEFDRRAIADEFVRRLEAAGRC
jgi:glycosyltransferase involved in cell wall biosynthesis